MSGTSIESRIEGLADRFKVIHVGERKCLAATIPFEDGEDVEGLMQDLIVAIGDWQRDKTPKFCVRLEATPFEGHVATEKGNWIYFYLEIPVDVDPDIVVRETVKLTEYLLSMTAD